VTSKFTVTPHLCLAINNIDYVLQFIRPFVEELGIDETLLKLEISNGEVVARYIYFTIYQPGFWGTLGFFCRASRGSVRFFKNTKVQLIFNSFLKK
jgi:hypothetical protein